MRRRRRGSVPTRILQPEFLWRVLSYGLLILILASAECSFFSALRFLPATPDLLLCAVVAVSLLDTRRVSTVFAIGAGFVLDAIGGVGIPLCALLYLTVAAVVGSLGEKMLPRYGSYLVLMIPSILFKELFEFLRILLGNGRDRVWEIVRHLLIPEAAITAVASLALYFLVKLCMLPFREKRRAVRTR